MTTYSNLDVVIKTAVESFRGNEELSELDNQLRVDSLYLVGVEISKGNEEVAASIKGLGGELLSRADAELRDFTKLGFMDTFYFGRITDVQFTVRKCLTWCIRQNKR